MKKLIKRFLPILDFILLPFIYPSAILLKFIRISGVQRLPNCKNAFLRVGVFPIRKHYYEPQFDNRVPQPDFSKDRRLAGIDWNIEGQLSMLDKLKFADELINLQKVKSSQTQYYLNNRSFISGDAEYWYQIIRAIKPKRIIEIGSGNSTLMAIKAIKKNCDDNPNYKCEHICIEPYEQPWLEKTGVSVFRKKVEDVEISLFSQLQEDDILFIDSSHVIKPQGDVTFEYLELLPTLNKGVIVHVHDIFSPKNYLKQWLQEDVRFWNEQYLVEAFLTHNSCWEIIGALNFLHHSNYSKLKSVAPFLEPDREPGSFYIRKLV